MPNSSFRMQNCKILCKLVTTDRDAELSPTLIFLALLKAFVLIHGNLNLISLIRAKLSKTKFLIQVQCSLMCSLHYVAWSGTSTALIGGTVYHVNLFEKRNLESLGNYFLSMYKLNLLFLQQQVVLQNLKKCIRPGGNCFVAVPASKPPDLHSALNKIIKSNTWSSYFTVRHYSSCCYTIRLHNFLVI